MLTNADASLLQYLPSKRGLGVTCILLIQLLVATQNELLEVSASQYARQRNSTEMGIRAAAMSDLVAYDAHKDLLALVQQHCNYSLEVRS